MTATHFKSERSPKSTHTYICECSPFVLHKLRQYIWCTNRKVHHFNLYYFQWNDPPLLLTQEMYQWMFTLTNLFFDHFEGVLSWKEWHLSPDLVIIWCNIDIFTKLNDKCHSFCGKTPLKWSKTNLWGWTFTDTFLFKMDSLAIIWQVHLCMKQIKQI